MWLDDDVKSYLQPLRREFAKNFLGIFPNLHLPDFRTWYLVLDNDIINMFDYFDNIQEQFISFANDSTTQDIFKEKSLPSEDVVSLYGRNRFLYSPAFFILKVCKTNDNIVFFTLSLF